MKKEDITGATVHKSVKDALTHVSRELAQRHIAFHNELLKKHRGRADKRVK